MHYLDTYGFTPINDRYLFLDMNSFFARCEQQLNPSWRNKPVVVAPYTGHTGCCIAVSSEAKKLGIRTGTGVGEARRIYPQVIVAESRPDVYRKIHYQLLDIASNFSPWIDVQSVDEMAIPLTQRERGGDNPVKLSLAIKKALKEHLGDYLTASIGIGPNIFLAKQAAEDKKPDGLTILRLDNLESFYSKKKLTDLTGIAYPMAAKLNRLGITTPLELYNTSAQLLRKKLGINGEYWYLHLHGYPIRHTSDQTKSLGHSCVLPPEARNWLTAERVLQKLIERAGLRLRKKRLTAGGVQLSIKFLGYPSYHGHAQTLPFNDSLTFYHHIYRLWEQAPRLAKPFLIAITTYNLSYQPLAQPELFPVNKKRTDIYHSLDIVNRKFGDWTLRPATLLNTDKFAPNRIPFGKLRY